MLLICLPSAGSSTAIFSPWLKSSGLELEILVLDYSGHGHRVDEPLYESIEDYADDVLSLIFGRICSSPYALFGHSMGAFVAYILCRRIVERRLPAPKQVFISSARAPRHIGGTLNLAELSDDQLIADLVDANDFGFAPSVQFELLKRTSDLTRSDIRSCAAVRDLGATLPFDVHLMSGDNDPLISPADLSQWRSYFTGNVQETSYPGKHFYCFSTSARAVLGDIAASFS